jgi:phosphomevalonate kinase
LQGAPAVVAAVDRRLIVSWTERAVAMPPEVEATLELARAQCGSTPGSLIVDASALRRDEVKLGLGSSAAAAAATAGAVFATNGQDLEDHVIARRVFECALRGHAAVAPQGSGVDVAASTLGGFLRFRRAEGVPETRQLRAPEGLSIRLIWTGRAARTSDLVAKVHELRRADPALHACRMSQLEELAMGFSDAFDRGDAEGVVEAAASYARAMAALGDAAGAPIVEARLSQAAKLAARFSGSAKPCGAGGGDVAIAFFVDSEAGDAFELACRDEGLHPIPVSWGAPGVRAC